MQEYHFKVDVAILVGGADAAAIIHNIAFWMERNRKNGFNFYDGRYWTFNSSRAFHELFPWLSEHQVYRKMKKLEENGFIQTGNYNKKGYDRTLWYTIIDDRILQIYNLHFAESQDGFCENTRAIPDSKPDSKLNIISDDNIIRDKRDLQTHIVTKMSSLFKKKFASISVEFVAASRVIKRVLQTVREEYVKQPSHQAELILCQEIIDKYIDKLYDLKTNSGKSFWKNQIMTPTRLSSRKIWDILTNEMEINKTEKQEQDDYEEGLILEAEI